MILYWSDKPLDKYSSGSPERDANAVEVDPFSIREQDQDFLILHAVSTGDTLNRNPGYNRRVIFTLSEDQYSRRVVVNGSSVSVWELVKAWRRARFMWIQDDLVNGGKIVSVTHAKEFEDKQVGDNSDMNETTYELTEAVWHV